MRPPSPWPHLPRRSATSTPLLLLVLLLAFSAAPRGTQSLDIDVRTRTHWEELVRICPNRSYTSCDGVDRSGWTDASKTQFNDFRFAGLGQWSTFKVVTYDFRGARKTRGGDSWYVVLRDRKQRLKVPTRIFDDGDGTYTAAVYFLKPGTYSIAAWLWYSNCNGLQEPVMAMREYEIGGKTPLNKKDHCYSGGRVSMTNFPVVDANLPPPPCMQPGCALKKAPAQDAATGGTLFFRMETYYYRQNHTYLAAPCCKPRFPKPAQQVKRFLFYGDSTVKNSWEMLQYMARQTCVPMWKPRHVHEMFDLSVCKRVDSLDKVDPELDTVLKRCTGGVPWSAVPIGTNTYDVSRYHALSMLFDMSNFTYNDTFVKSHVPPVPLPLPREFTFIYVDGWGCRGVELGADWGVFKDLEHVSPGDVVVMNIGAHCSRSMSFGDWQKYMDKVAAWVKTVIQKTGAPIIWRTSFLMKEHVFRSYTHADGYVPPAHFNTEHRRLIFDSYAESVLVPAGVHIWDVYGISHMGDYRPHDMVHSDGMTCWAMNTDMMDLFACFD